MGSFTSDVDGLHLPRAGEVRLNFPADNEKNPLVIDIGLAWASGCCCKSSVHDNVFAGLRLAVLALAARLPHLLGQEPAVGEYQSNSAHKSRPSVLQIAKFIYT